MVENNGSVSMAVNVAPAGVNIRGCLVSHRHADYNSSDPPQLSSKTYGYPSMLPWLQITTAIWSPTIRRLWMPRPCWECC